MNRIVIIAMIVLTGVSVGTAQEKIPDELQTKAAESKSLFAAGKYVEYVHLLDGLLEKYPQFRQDMLQGKLQALDKLDRKPEAVLVAIVLDSLDGAVNVGAPCDIARRYALCNDTANTYAWARISADRGFQNDLYYRSSDEFRLLQSHPQFNALIEQIKGNSGLGKPAKQFTRIDITGKEISLQNYLGRVVLVDFWATWCNPCVVELPNLVQLYGDFKAQGFEIIGISVDKDKNLLDKFLAEKKIAWPIVFGGLGWKDETKELYGVKLVPATWVIDKKGIVRYSQLKGEKLRAAIAALVKE